LRPDDRVLEIGTGSGYQAAVLSRLAGEVFTIEISRPLAERAARTLERLGYRNIRVRCADGYEGWAEHAPFDKIIVTCSPENVPARLVEELREGGRMVIPLGQRYQQTLCSLVKRDGRLVAESCEPTFFVPMLGQAEAQRSAPLEEALSPLANGDFESLLEGGRPAVWYYLRQASLASGGPSASSRRCLAFANRVPRYYSQALQAIGVDGRRVAQLEVSLAVKCEEVERASPLEGASGAKLIVGFFDADRRPVGQQVLGPWLGSFDWRRERNRSRVPREARLAIVAAGLMGATGRFWCDDVEIRP
jgi:protein-L-isoaspartate(D-aspartate) O-methyltransferase